MHLCKAGLGAHKDGIPCAKSSYCLGGVWCAKTILAGLRSEAGSLHGMSDGRRDWRQKEGSDVGRKLCFFPFTATSGHQSMVGQCGLGHRCQACYAVLPLARRHEELLSQGDSREMVDCSSITVDWGVGGKQKVRGQRSCTDTVLPGSNSITGNS